MNLKNNEEYCIVAILTLILASVVWLSHKY